MKKIISTLVSVAITLAIIPVIPTFSVESLELSFSSHNVTDERLVELVESGEIPHNVTYLYLRHNQITDITPLSSLTNLRWLSLNNNQITDLSPLSSLTNLQRLELDRNQVYDLRPLSELVNLQWLKLDNNQITDLTGLETLTNLGGSLGILGVRNNQITDLTPISRLTNLQWLALENNQIEDLTPLEWLVNLQLTFVDLSGNPVTDEQIEDFKAAVRENRKGGILTFGHVLGIEPYTIADALEILMYLAGLPSIIEVGSNAWYAAMIVSVNEPTIDDVLEILLFLADLPNKITGGA